MFLSRQGLGLLPMPAEARVVKRHSLDARRHRSGGLVGD